MIAQSLTDHIQQQLSDYLGRDIIIQSSNAVGGGCINQSYLVSSTTGERWFVKTNQAHLLPMFEAEYVGLQALKSSNSFIIPMPLFSGQLSETAYLVLEYLDLSGSCNDKDFAGRLAKLHLTTHDRFGFSGDNFIGASPQYNDWHNNWFEFFMQQRLERQLKMMVDKGTGSELERIWPELLQACRSLFSDHRPLPSLLHGDLWMGNVSGTPGGCSIYDPACYYGDFEADLAMLELFGHLSSQFYQHYYQDIKKVPGSGLRKTWYNLYHIMNHANLFGGSYYHQARQMCQQLINHSQG